MRIALLDRCSQFADRVALHDERGEHTYAELDAASAALAHGLLAPAAEDLAGARIAYLLPPGFDHVATQWGIWRAGGVAVPLAATYPAPEIARLLRDAGPAAVLADDSLRSRAEEAAATVGAEVVTPAELLRRSGDSDAAPGGESAPVHRLPALEPQRPAMMVYTSGTTGEPKGVVTTHGILEAQISTLVDAWEWAPQDRILHVLPLHHIHGIVNALCCALWSGACCQIAAPQARGIWERLASGEVTVFMAVPTIYRRLIAAWDDASGAERERWAAGAAALRLMVSGSAALPVETLERWEEITGHRLLERYGMTEIGMALGNPLHGERRPGTVGQPFAGVEARIVGEDGAVLGAGEQGEIQVRGAQVFLQYWQRPQDTAAAFTADGWFRTGDEGVVEDGYWRIVGRASVDIIKSGGYKISALEIESVLRAHDAVEDAAVVGVEDEDWGERVCAAVVVAADATPSTEMLRRWCGEHLAPYKVPKQLAVVTRLPRNSMGKVTKVALRPLFFDAEP